MFKCWINSCDDSLKKCNVVTSMRNDSKHCTSVFEQVSIHGYLKNISKCKNTVPLTQKKWVRTLLLQCKTDIIRQLDKINIENMHEFISGEKAQSEFISDIWYLSDTIQAQKKVVQFEWHFI